MRTFAEMWASLSFDSFPALYFVILRLFAGVPASVSDGSLRVFGAAIGLLVLFAVWLNARWLRLGVPLITLALIGFNPMVIRYGDSIRAYGLGILLALLTIGAMWRLIESFTLRRALVVVVIAVLERAKRVRRRRSALRSCLAAATVTLRRRKIVQTLLFLQSAGSRPLRYCLISRRCNGSDHAASCGRKHSLSPACGQRQRRLSGRRFHSAGGYG